MRGLSQFTVFDWNAFAEGKTFIVTDVSEYQDFDTKAHLGTKVTVVITNDDTKYQFKEGEEHTNLYEKITFKVPKDIKLPIRTQVVPKNPVAKIYGDYRNQLAVTCDDIIVVSPKEK